MKSVNTHDAELNLIVSVIKSGSFAGSLLRGFEGEYIQDPEYRKVWEELVTAWNKYGKIPDMTTVVKDYPDIRTYLLKANPVEPPEFYADIIIDNYTRFGLADKIIQSLGTLEQDTKEGIRELQGVLGEFDLIQSQVEVLTLANTGRERFDAYHEQATYGIDFGYPTLDKATLGAHPGQVIGLAARSGQGKTWMLLSWAYHAWRTEGSKVLFICTEIPARDMMRRFDALYLKVNHADLRSKILTDAIYQKYEGFLLDDDPRKDDMIFVDGASMTPEAISSLVDQLNPDAVYVDGIYMLGSSERKTEKDWEKIRAIIKGLKDVALRQQIPVFYNSQFNRDVASAGNTGRGKVVRGGLEHLAFGDSLGMWSDMIIGITRTSEDVANKVMEMRVIKGRDTADGLTWHVSFDFNDMDFREVEMDYSSDDSEDTPW